MSNNKNEEMKKEYDFRGKEGVRGKYYKKMKEGHKTIIHKSYGSTFVRETRAIFLEPDVQEYFPDSETVNKALRELIEIKS